MVKKKLLNPTYKVNGYLRILTGTLVQKIISLTYGVDGLPRTPTGVLVRKLLSPIYRVDGSPRIQTGTLVQKISKSNPWGGWVTKDADECKKVLSPSYWVDRLEH